MGTSLRFEKRFQSRTATVRERLVLNVKGRSLTVAVRRKSDIQILRPSAQFVGRLRKGTCQEAVILGKVPANSTNAASHVSSDLTLFGWGVNIRLLATDVGPEWAE